MKVPGAELENAWKKDELAIHKKVQFFRRSPQSKTLAPVGNQVKGDEWKSVSIAVDSGACDNVIGPDDIPGYRDHIRETPDSLRGDCFISASGEEIPKYGEVTLPLITREHGARSEGSDLSSGGSRQTTVVSGKAQSSWQLRGVRR